MIAVLYKMHAFVVFPKRPIDTEVEHCGIRDLHIQQQGVYTFDERAKDHNLVILLI